MDDSSGDKYYVVGGIKVRADGFELIDLSMGEAYYEGENESWGDKIKCVGDELCRFGSVFLFKVYKKASDDEARVCPDKHLLGKGAQKYDEKRSDAETCDDVHQNLMIVGSHTR